MNTNGTLMQMFEWYLPQDCNHWKKCAAEAKNLAETGITAVWLPPAFKCAKGKSDVGYGIYDIYDLGEFNQKGTIPTKYGTKEEYLQAIDAFKANSVHVYGDVVLNHKMGADALETVQAHCVRGDNRECEEGECKTIEAWTAFNFDERNNKYSDFKWNHTHFSGVDWDEKTDSNNIFLIQGKDWADEVDKEKGNYDYLMGADIDFENKEVVQELINWGKWYISHTNIDGLRLDAVKHISADFYKKWIEQMRLITGAELFCVGEYWHGDVSRLNYYLGETEYRLSLFDVPLHYNLYNASTKKEGFDLRRIFDGTLVSQNPIKAVTFVDNHDTQPNQALASFIEQWFKYHAYSLLLLRESGYPCVFYGDYYGIPTHNVPKLDYLPRLIHIRKNLAYGYQHDFFEDYNTIGFTREGDEGYKDGINEVEGHKDSGIAVLLTNAGATQKYMYIGKKFANKEFYDALNANKPPVIINNDGWGCFSVEEKSVSVYTLIKNWD